MQGQHRNKLHAHAPKKRANKGGFRKHLRVGVNCEVSLTSVVTK